jgi:pimeloyl-ACP methyl ester carboxylesterase
MGEGGWKMTFLYVLLVLVVLILGVGIGYSFYLTKRFQLTQTLTPSEYGMEYEEITFPAADGMSLCGVWIPSPGSTRAVVILHGHGGSLDWDIQRAPYFHRAGFNVMLFDFRAHGRSAGQVATFGYLERQDVVGAVRFLRSRGVERIGLLGFSYGGMASMLAAPLCEDIHAVVSDGGPARLRSAIEGRCIEWHLPRWLGRFLGYLVIAITSLRLGVNLFQFEPVRWVGRITPRPILFIHGELDLYLPDFNELFAAAHEPKEAWRLPGVDHTKASEAQPEEFYRRVVGFFQQNL